MRLHVGELAAKQLCQPLDRQALDHIDVLAAAVVALARQPFRVFVREHGALRLEDGAADDIFRGDQLDLVALAAEFLADRARDPRVGVVESGGEEPLLRNLCTLRNRHPLLLAKNACAPPGAALTASRNPSHDGGYGFRAASPGRNDAPASG